MKKFITFLLILLGAMFQPVSAEKFPVKISPTQIISTHHDETQIGDWIPFEVVNDVYLNDKLYIKKGTRVIGFVDFFHPNGWAGDSAELVFKSFETTDINNRKITISYPLILNGNSTRTSGVKQYLSWELFAFIRGSEVYIEPDSKTFNIFLVK